MRHNLALRPPLRHAVLGGWLVFVAVLAALVIRSTMLGTALADTTARIASEQQMAASVQQQLALAQRRAAPRLRAAAVRDTLQSDAIDPGVLRRVERAIPADVWLVTADLGHGHLTLDGRALRWQDVAGFADALQRVPGVTDPEISSVGQWQAAGEFGFHIVAAATGPGTAGAPIGSRR